VKKIFVFVLGLFLFNVGCATYHIEVKNEEVHIYLKKPEAENVYLLCSLDEYTPHPVAGDGSGKWGAVLPANMEFKYFFLVDGKVFIPACEMKEKDDFGSENCVYSPLLP